MTNRSAYSQHGSPAQLTASLHRRGLSPLGAQQALRGQVVSAPNDRAAIAEILAAAASEPQYGPGGKDIMVGGAGKDHLKPGPRRSTNPAMIFNSATPTG